MYILEGFLIILIATYAIYWIVDVINDKDVGIFWKILL
jgi:hypothetical protein